VRLGRILLVVLGAALIFVAGVGLGQALNDNESSGDTQTLVRTLDPLALAPAARTTVTVTTTAP
jgi:hypothetical protein